jgi:hypothetical protein
VLPSEGEIFSKVWNSGNPSPSWGEEFSSNPKIAKFIAQNGSRKGPPYQFLKICYTPGKSSPL